MDAGGSDPAVPPSGGKQLTPPRRLEEKVTHNPNFAPMPHIRPEEEQELQEEQAKKEHDDDDDDDDGDDDEHVEESGSLHMGGSSSAANLRVRLERDDGRPLAFLQVHALIQRGISHDVSWESEVADVRMELITAFIAEFDAAQDRLHPRDKYDEVIRDFLILNKYMQFLAVTRRLRPVRGQGNTSSITQRTPAEDVDVNNNSYDSCDSDVSTNRPATRDDLEAMERRLKAHSQNSPKQHQQQHVNLTDHDGSDAYHNPAIGSGDNQNPAHFGSGGSQSGSDKRGEERLKKRKMLP